jgi:hypothetical protein
MYMQFTLFVPLRTILLFINAKRKDLQGPLTYKCLIRNLSKLTPLKHTHFLYKRRKRKKEFIITLLKDVLQ